MAGGLLPPVVAELVARTDGFAAKMGAARAEMEKTSGTGAKAFTGLAAAGKVALLGIGAAAAVVGTYSIKAASDFEDAHAQLAAAFKTTGSTAEEYRNQITAADKQGVKFGYNQTQIESALTVMVRGMRDGDHAVRALGIAQDLAAAKHMSLADAALLVTKASEGQIRPLKALGIDLPVTAGGAAKLAKAHDALAKAQEAQHVVQERVRIGLLKGPAAYDALTSAQAKVADAQHKVNVVAGTGQAIMEGLGNAVKGSAAAQAETFRGKIDQLHAKISNLAITIGTWLIPKLLQLGDIIGKVVNWFEKHKEVAILLGVAVGTVLVAAIYAYIASLVEAAVAQLAVLWPIILIVAAIALLGAAIYELVTHWKTIWKAISGAVSDAWDWIKNAVDVGFHAVLDFFKRLPGEALRQLERLPGLLAGLGKLAIRGMLLALRLEFKLALAWFIGIPTLILTAIGDVNRLLWHHGGDIIRGLWAGAKLIFEGLLFWFVQLPIKILQALPGAIKWLWNIGGDVLRGLWHGAIAIFANVATWFSEFPSRIKSAIGDLGSILYDVGKAILHGLWEGMKAVWNDLTGWLSGLGHAITNLKGPPSVDAVLLHKNGLLIMDGFRRGLQEGWTGAKSDLADMTAHIGSATIGAGAHGAGGGQTVNVTVHVDARNSIGLDARQMERVVVDSVSRHFRRGGTFPFKVLPT